MDYGIIYHYIDMNMSSYHPALERGLPQGFSNRHFDFFCDLKP